MSYNQAFNVVQTVLAAGSHLLSDEHMSSWQDLTSTDQHETASQLTTAVESSSFMRADLSASPQTIVVDYSNIGTRQTTLSFTGDTRILGPNTMAIIRQDIVLC